MGLKIRRATRRVEVCLDGTLKAEYEQLDAAYKAATSEGKKGADRAKQIKAEAVKVSHAARAETVVFVLQALPRAVWDELATLHPARDKDPVVPVDIPGITDAALSRSGTIVGVERLVSGEAEEFTSDDWESFSKDLSAAQHEDFQQVVLSLNMGSNDVPFLPESVATDDSGKS